MSVDSMMFLFTNPLSVRAQVPDAGVDGCELGLFPTAVAGDSRPADCLRPEARTYFETEVRLSAVHRRFERCREYMRRDAFRQVFAALGGSAIRLRPH